MRLAAVRRSLLMAACSLAPVLGLALPAGAQGAGAGPSDSDVGATSLPPPDDGGDGETIPPGVTFLPASGTFFSPGLTIRIEWCDNLTLDAASRQVKVRGTAVSSTYTTGTKSGCGAYAYSDVSVQLVDGTNAVWAYICDASANCTSASTSYTLAAADVTAPVPSVVPSSRTTSDAMLLAASSTQVVWCDDASLDAASRRMTFNGADVTSRFGYATEAGLSGCPVRARSTLLSGSLQLEHGDNSLVGTIRDSAGNVGTGTSILTYKPQLSLAPTNQGTRVPGPFELGLTYSTPAYVSLDTERSVTLFYGSGQAAPVGKVVVDVTDESSTPPVRYSIRLRRPDGSWVALVDTATAFHYSGGSGTTRLSAWFDAGTLPTAAHDYTVVVGGVLPDSSRVESTAPVRVLIVNERSTSISPGWTIAGVHRIHAQAGGVVLTAGDGSARYFAAGSCFEGSCSYTSPAGEHSTLSRTEATGEYLLRDPEGTELRFAGDGWLRTVRDRFGSQTTFGYTSTGKLATITDPAGGQIALTYDALGRLDRITDPGGRYSRLVYNTNGDLLRIVDPAGGTPLNSVMYDTMKLVSQWADRGGNLSYPSFDRWRTLSQTRGPLYTAQAGQTFRDTTWLTSQERQSLPGKGLGTATAPGARIRPELLRALIIDQRRDTTTLALDAWNAPTIVRGPAGDSTRVVRNPAGQVEQAFDARGKLTSYQWSGSRLMEVSSPEGTRTFGYEVFGYNQVVQISGTGMPLVQSWYAANGTRDSTRVEGFGVLRYSHDTRGRMLSATDPDGHFATWEYHAGGTQNLSTSTAAGRRTYYTHDVHGRVVRLDHPDQSGSTIEYDVLNRQVAGVSPDAGRTEFYYGALFLDRIVGPEGEVTELVRNALGWVEKEIAPGDVAGMHRTTEYDRYGRVAATVDRRGLRVATTYDRWDRPTAVTADGKTTTFAYSHSKAPGPNESTWMMASNAESTDTLRFNPKGQLVDAVTVRPTSAGSRRYSVRSDYDLSARVRLMVQVGTATAVDTVGFAYNDSTRQLQAVRDFSRGITALGYNADGLPNRITLPSGQVRTQGYLANHQLADIHYLSNQGLDDVAGAAYTYDSRNRLSVVTSPNGERKRTFGYDGDGRLGSFADAHLSGTEKPTCEWSDNDGWVCSESTHLWTTSHSESYAYDRNGNPTDRGAVVGAGDRLTAYDGWTLGYDAEGNVTQRSNGTVSQTLEWNALGQLTGVETAGQGWVRYAYDAFGRRVNRLEVATGVRTHFVYDGGDLVMELDGGGNVQAQYTYYPGTDQVHSVRRAGQTYFYATDRQGNVRALVNSANQVVNRYAYRPFGAHESVSETIPNPLRYNAREFDPATGLYYYRARWYDPAVHRFLSEDPAAEGTNMYAYVSNDPVNYTDPTGMYQQPTHPCAKNPRPCRLAAIRVSVGGWWRESRTAGAMTIQFITGGGPSERTFGSGTPQVEAVRTAPGVNNARELLCSKYSAGEENPSVSGYGARFGLRGVISAGLQPTRQFVGSYDVNISGNGDGTATYRVTNATSMRSASYRTQKSYERTQFNHHLARFGFGISLPGGTVRQTYTWSENVASSCSE